MSTPADPQLRSDFLAAMGRVAATVTVVTTDGPAGWAGATVTAMASVSADSKRPTLLVCVNAQGPSAAAIKTNAVFCVNVLAEEHSYIADGFANRFKTAAGDKFFSGSWSKLATGAPFLDDAVAAFECRLVASPQVGTHFVFVGEVEAIHTAPDRHPLIYVQRGYGRAVRLDAAGHTPAPPGQQSKGLAERRFCLRDAAAGAGVMLLLALAGLALRQWPF